MAAAADASTDEPRTGVTFDTAGTDPDPASLFTPTRDPRVWRAVLTMYIGAGLLFLVNNALGFLNVLEAGDLPRWQGLVHLHAATIGWIVLGVMATAVWLFVGQRSVTDRMARFTTTLAWFSVLAFAGYIAAFALSFSRGDPYWVLLPIFGTAAALAIIAAFLFATAQLRHQAVLTAPHLALAGALFATSMGAIMGVLLGVRNAGGPDVLGDNWFAHPISMDLFVILAMMGIAEALAARGVTRYRWHALLQVGLITVAVLIADAAFLAGDADLAFIVAFPMFLAGTLTYLIRAAWRPLAVNPFRGGPAANTFWGGLGLIVFIVIFIVVPEENTPHWMEIAFLHFLGIGAAANLLLATQSRAAARPGGWLEPAAAWVMNLGLLAFIAGEYVAERADGAILMGIGVVVAVVAVGLRLMRTRGGGAGRPGQGAAAP